VFQRSHMDPKKDTASRGLDASTTEMKRAWKAEASTSIDNSIPLSGIHGERRGESRVRWRLARKDSQTQSENLGISRTLVEGEKTQCRTDHSRTRKA